METARIFLTGGALIISIVYMAIPVIIAGALVSISKTLHRIEDMGLAARPFTPRKDRL